MRDLCPDVDGRLASADITDGQHTDSDADFVGDDCDRDPGFCDHLDDDRDGIPDRLDACPTIPVGRHSASDIDGDGVADACDRCLFGDDRDPTLDLTTDADGDAVPDACDNCAGSNPSQADCNLDAEQATLASCGSSCPSRSEIFRGDRCDPTPCGETQVGLSSDLTRRRIDIDGQASVPRGLARTGSRFCRCQHAERGDDLLRRIACRERDQPDPEDPGFFLGECDPLDIATYDDAVEAQHWRWTTLHREGDASPSLRTEYSASYARPIFAGFEPDITAQWIITDDLRRWAMLFPSESRPIAAIPGVLWTHTPGPTSGGNWTAPRERELATHLWSGDLPLVGFEAPDPPPCEGAFAPLIVPDDVCLVCGSELPIPWLAYGGIPRCRELDFDRVMIVIGSRALEPQPGLDVEGIDRFGERPNAKWIPSAETGSWLGREGIRYAAVEDSVQIAEVLNYSPGFGLVPLGQQQCVPGQCDPVPGALAAAAEQIEDVPSARVGAVYVLSSMTRRLWMLGGESDVGDPLPEVWAYDLDARTWEQVPTPVPLGHVLAATWSPAHRSLVILDELARRGRPEARLIGLDARGHWSRVLASWRRGGRNERFELSADPDGGLYIVGHHRRAPFHAVLRVDVEPIGLAPDHVRFRGLAIGRGRVADGGVRASDRGVTVVVVDDVQGAQGVGYEPADFLPDPRADERVF